MQSEQEDERLRDLFHALRETERRITPPFSQIWRKAALLRERPPRRRRIWAPAAVSAGVATIAMLVALIHLVLVSEDPSDDNATLAQWRSPTAFLLTYPGQDLLERVPELDRSSRLYGRTDSI